MFSGKTWLVGVLTGLAVWVTAFSQSRPEGVGQGGPAPADGPGGPASRPAGGGFAPGGFAPGGPGGFMPGPGGLMPFGGDNLAEVKTQIRASDEEWKVIGPKLRKVVATRQAAETGLDYGEGGLSVGGVFPPGGGFGSPFGRGGFRPPGGPGFGGDSFTGPGGRGPGGPPPGDFRPGGPPPGDFRPGGRGPGGPPPGDFRPGGPTPGDFPPGDFPPGGPPPGDFSQGGPPPPGGFDPRPQVDGQPGFAATRPSAGPASRPAGGGFGPGGPGGFDRFRPGGGPGFGGPPPGGPGGFGGAGMAVMQAIGELRTALADAKSTPEQIQAKVEAVRAARRKALAQAQAAQKDLLELLTPDQEATLASLGYID